MGKREQRELRKAEKARFDARVAVYRGLWERPAFVRMNEHKDKLNRAITLAMATPGGDVAAAQRRFSRYHRRIIAIERAALAAAGFPHG